jgi:hypothetical protein
VTVKHPSVFECLEPDGAKFLKKSTATLQQLLRAHFFSFAQAIKNQERDPEQAL